MKKKGFILIHGTRFPVFIDPKTQDEYALARKEVKTGSSHQDFEFVFTPDITLEEDLYRRDFTINTLVMNESEELVKTSLTELALSDIKNKIIRMVSKEHFSEDPLRAVRAINFPNSKIMKHRKHLTKRMLLHTLTYLRTNTFHWNSFKIFRFNNSSYFIRSLWFNSKSQNRCKSDCSHSS